MNFKQASPNDIVGSFLIMFGFLMGQLTQHTTLPEGVLDLPAIICIILGGIFLVGRLPVNQISQTILLVLLGGYMLFIQFTYS